MDFKGHENRDEAFYVYWDAKRGILLYFYTYGDNINGGEFAYNWISWKEDSLSECLLDIYMFRLHYKYWHNGKWIVGLWNREDRQFNPVKEKWVKAE